MHEINFAKLQCGMKKFFLLFVMASASLTLFYGCQKYDDSEIRQEIKDLGEKVARLESWCKSSQEAVDYVAVLKDAVNSINSIESVAAFDDETGSGYVITFTNKQSIKLYNGKDGDTFFGNVTVGSSFVEFILADGSKFIIDRLATSISFDSFETKNVARGDTIWTVMNEVFTKSEYAAFTAELKTDDGTATSIATKSASEGREWNIEAIAPKFKEDGSLARSAGVVISNASEAGGRGVLKVSLVTNNGKETSSSLVIDVMPNYLSFSAVEAGASVSMEIFGEYEAPSIEYSTNGLDWTAFDFSSPQTITLPELGDKVYWRNTGEADYFSKNENQCIAFVLGESKVAADGNVMSLIDKSCKSLAIPRDACFNYLFAGCKSLVSAPDLPATQLTPYCYEYMFYGCKSLEEAPDLPADVVPYAAYSYMFHSCSSIGKAPELPAKEVGDFGYQWMFSKCTSLTEAPSLPADKIGESCYYSMFRGCSSLVKAPQQLPAANLADFCYQQMFADCTSLKEAPLLPATTMKDWCYSIMFAGCKSLEKAPKLPAIELKEGCYYEMFAACPSLKEAPELPAEKMASMCYQDMFLNCISLESAPELPAKELAKQCYMEMFANCKALKDAPELTAEKMAYLCYHGMFLNCSALEKAHAIAATEMDEWCFYRMFMDCVSLKEGPDMIPAEKMAYACNYEMFRGCTSLEKAPALPATVLAESCYGFMFLECTSLEEAPYLPAIELVPECYYGMFYGCESVVKAPELPATKLVDDCYTGLFYGCTSLNHIKVHFTDWENSAGTDSWVSGVPSVGSFECPADLEIKYGDSNIPTGWSVNGTTPANTNSFATSATKLTNGTHLMPIDLKTPKIQDIPVKKASAYFTIPQ